MVEEIDGDEGNAERRDEEEEHGRSAREDDAFDLEKRKRKAGNGQDFPNWTRKSKLNQTSNKF